MESGLYCRAITLRTAEVSGSIVTIPPLTSRGELGKPLIAAVLFSFSHLFDFRVSHLDWSGAEDPASSLYILTSNTFRGRILVSLSGRREVPADDRRRS